MYVPQGEKMTLAVFLLPHVIDDPGVEDCLREKLKRPIEDVIGRLKNNEDHRLIFSQEELSKLDEIFRETVGVHRLALISWSSPVFGEMAAFSYRDKYFIVSERELTGPMTEFKGVRLPVETFGLECDFDRTRVEAVRLIEELFQERNGEVIKLNGEEMLSLGGELLPIPNISCCTECIDPDECRHVFCVIDDASSAILGGYLADKQIVLAKLLERVFLSFNDIEDPVWGTKDERNARILSRLMDVYRKRNGRGLSALIRNENFFRLIRNLLEATCNTILHPEESLLSGFEIHPVCFVSDNVVDDFERLKLYLLSELGQDGDLNVPNEFGTIA